MVHYITAWIGDLAVSLLSAQIWDLRNMRSPVDSIRLDCGVNRLSVSHDERGLLAIPLDNRHIKLYDLKGSRVASVPRRNRQVGGSIRMYGGVDQIFR